MFADITFLFYFSLTMNFHTKKRALNKRLWLLLYFFCGRERQTSWCYKPQRILFERQRGLETSPDKNAPQKAEEKPSRRRRTPLEHPARVALSILLSFSTYAIFSLARRLSLFLLKIKVVILKSRLPGAQAEAHTHSLTFTQHRLSVF